MQAVEYQRQIFTIFNLHGFFIILLVVMRQVSSECSLEIIPEKIVSLF
jgi:hypothetical protein